MNTASPKPFDGAVLAARYAFMPNRLRYCGGDNNCELFNYAAAARGDDGLKEILKEFETMYPYLRLIAEANKITDPFNYRVVEAYWLGNELLEKVSMRNFYRYLVDEQKLKRKFKPKVLERVWGRVADGAKPHHSWHVFNIPRRTGHYPIEHTLETMDNCRISWGRVTSLSGGITVDYQPLELVDNKLILGSLVKKKIIPPINQSFIGQVGIGDYISIHWSWICDILSEQQKNNLEKWTRYNLNLSNLC